MLIAAAKAGIVGLTRSVACDVDGYGITCNAYHPFAYTRWRQSAEAAAGSGTPRMNHTKKRFELGLIDEEEYKWQSNPPTAEGVAPLVVYLATDEASGINGRIFYSSDGRVAIYSEPAREKTIIKREGIWTVEELMGEVPNMLLKVPGMFRHYSERSGTP